MVNNSFDNDRDIRLSSRQGSNKNETPNVLTNDNIKQMGLDPSDDRDFLNELIRFYDFNLVINS